MNHESSPSVAMMRGNYWSIVGRNITRAEKQCPDEYFLFIYLFIFWGDTLEFLASGHFLYNFSSTF